MKPCEKGFTLVEIAIVLVIIGLLLGGILKGQEMIVQARTKNIIADFSGISAAYHGYMDRYRAMPGDDPGVTRWGLTASAAPGNGVVAGAYNSGTATDESRLWWEHLRRAGFVSGTGSNQPLNAVNGMIGVQTGDAAGGAALGGLLSLLMCSANLPDKIAIGVDSQLDDGAIGTGSVRGQAHTAPNPTTPNPAIISTVDPVGPYQENGTNTYTVCRQL